MWERDEIEADRALNDDFVALELDPALSHGDAPWDNLIIEGDNGEDNFIANVIWQKVFSPKGTAQHFSDDHEYILVFACNRSSWRPNLLPRTSAQDKAYKNPDGDRRGPWTSGDLSARNYYSKGTYAITGPTGKTFAGPPPGMYWRFSEQRFKELDKDDRIWWGKDGSNTPRLKRFLSDVQQGTVPKRSAFHPDFVVACRERETNDHVALVEIKGSRGWADATDARKAEGPAHPVYGRCLFVGREKGGRFKLLKPQEKRLAPFADFEMQQLRWVE